MHKRISLFKLKATIQLWMTSIRVRVWAVSIGLALSVILVYSGVSSNGFIIFDDPGYVTDNNYVLDGIGIDSLRWAVTTLHLANWHPLTWVSHMMDISLFGMNPGAHHWVNVFFHLLNTLFLFGIFYRQTKKIWPCALLAALFAVHPLHVESVAWISERKDVLSTFFMMVSACFYVRYTETPGLSRYLLAVLFFLLGLLSKPMIVTFPFILLLIDIWPLGRIRLQHRLPVFDASVLSKRVFEKIPFFMLSAASCLITFLAQARGGAVASLEVLPLTIRIGNALTSYCTYLVKMIWPLRLGVIYPYPHPEGFRWWPVAASSVFLLFVSAMAVKQLYRRPYFAVGWFWYLGTLVPVIGIVQVGSQALADRYTYIPMVGLFICIAWFADEIRSKGGLRRSAVDIATVVSLVALSVLYHAQVGRWKNSETLFAHTVSVTSKNALAHHSYACALDAAGRPHEALVHFQKALDIIPNYSDARFNMGVLLMEMGRTDEAISAYQDLLDRNSDIPKAHFNLANALMIRGRHNLAVHHYEAAVRLAPDWAGLRNNAGIAWVKIGRPQKAVSHFGAALRLTPDNTNVRHNLAGAKTALRSLQIQEAELIARATDHPEDPAVLFRTAMFYKESGDISQAARFFRKVLAENPGDVDAVVHLARCLAMQGGFEAAIALLAEIIDRHPDRWDIARDLAAMYSRSGQTEPALKWLSEAFKRGFVDGDGLFFDPNFTILKDDRRFIRLIAQNGGR